MSVIYVTESGTTECDVTSSSRVCLSVMVLVFPEPDIHSPSQIVADRMNGYRRAIAADLTGLCRSVTCSKLAILAGRLKKSAFVLLASVPWTDLWLQCLTGRSQNVSLETLSARDKFWFHPVLRLRYGTNHEQLRSVLSRVRDLLTGNSCVAQPSLRVRSSGFGSSSLNLDIFAYVYARNWSHFLEIGRTTSEDCGNGTTNGSAACLAVAGDVPCARSDWPGR